MGRCMHFEMYSDDPEAAIRFYESVFGWTAQRWGDMSYWALTTGADDELGINGGISSGLPPNGQRVVNSIEVPDIDAAIGRAEEEGAFIVMPKTAIPGQGWFAYMTDPGGVVFGLFQEDTQAAVE